ncbi:hypothetical protein [Microbacterium sp.]|uniref:hypothetical protein n=1 Tax=Microbacterium sp. TaxID=51671 RepID=UPI003C783EE4
MARRTAAPVPPRDHTPDLPPLRAELSRLAARAEVVGADVTLEAGDVDAAHARLAESHLSAASVGRLDLTGATLADVAIDDLRAVELTARDSTWRNVVVDGGRIGTLDGLRAEWDGVTLRGLRIDYLSLPSASLTDVRIVGCGIGTLDLPEGRLTRVLFEDTRADEVDTRGLRPADLDLRGLEALTFTDPRGLSGTWLSRRQAELHALPFAQALGIRIAE